VVPMSRTPRDMGHPASHALFALAGLLFLLVDRLLVNTRKRIGFRLKD